MNKSVAKKASKKPVIKPKKTKRLNVVPKKALTKTKITPNPNVSRRFYSSSARFEKENAYLDDYEDSFDDDEDFIEEEQRVNEIIDHFEDFVSKHDNYLIIATSPTWAILAKTRVLNINEVINASGFQPLNRTTEHKKCLLTAVFFGDEQNFGSLAYALQKMGCPMIKIRNKHEIPAKLNGL